MADGPEAFIAILHQMRGEFPELRLELKMVIAQGDHVATHARLHLGPDHPGRALADFFTLEDGKVVEHWDVIQELPADRAAADNMF